jgi:hypothetical protein
MVGIERPGRAHHRHSDALPVLVDEVGDLLGAGLDVHGRLGVLPDAPA